MVLHHLVFLLSPIYLVVADEFAYTVIVPARKTECYGFTIANEKYRSFEVDFQVIAGGESDITFYITSPKGLRLINDFKHTDGTHNVDLSMVSAGYGDYLFCFDNTFSIQSDKRNVTTNVKNNLNIIERLQRQYASIEMADRTAIERSYEMINFWSVLHLFVMLFALSVQVYMVRSLFEENSKIGRILRKGRLND
ncbi:Transmembrane emp24 domain-containing protein 5 [Dirofilaria immitis]|nr:Transmembrane emp24 domain-containing protein 5 [Dirofilaria immitis]